MFLLSSENDEATVHLQAPVTNDKVASTGRPYGWTLAQRYTSLARLRRPGVTKTSDLDAAGPS